MQYAGHNLLVYILFTFEYEEGDVSLWPGQHMNQQLAESQFLRRFFCCCWPKVAGVSPRSLCLNEASSRPF